MAYVNAAAVGDIFDLSIFQPHEYFIRIYSDAAEVPAAKRGKGFWVFPRRRPVLSILDDRWAAPVPAWESRCRVLDLKE